MKGGDWCHVQHETTCVTYVYIVFHVMGNITLLDTGISHYYHYSTLVSHIPLLVDYIILGKHMLWCQAVFCSPQVVFAPAESMDVFSTVTEEGEGSGSDSDSEDDVLATRVGVSHEISLVVDSPLLPPSPPLPSPPLPPSPLPSSPERRYSLRK